MKGIKVDFKRAQSKLTELRKKNAIDETHRIKKLSDGLAIPLKKEFWADHKARPYKFERENKKAEFKDILKNILNKEELKQVKTSYDTLGNIVVLEIDENLRSKEKQIAQAVLRTKPNTETVVRKDAPHEGSLRLQKMKHLAGKKTFIARHVENGCVFEFDITKTYFSVRLSHERKRIAGLVRPGEAVLVMFSGVGPYPIEIAKNTQAKSVVAIELNKYAHERAQDNIVKNKVKNVLALQGDAKIITLELKRTFDRIIMPLPKNAGEYLDTALQAANKAAVVHFYDFQKDGEFSKSHEKILRICKRCKKRCKILRTVKCGQSAPREYRICVDFRID